MKYRHELKYAINYADFLDLKMRLSKFLKVDPHSDNGIYTISSLYFDTLNNKAVFEKLDGESYREKYRIRYYGDDTDNIYLEKKVKIDMLGYKERVKIDKTEVEKILNRESSLSSKYGIEITDELFPKTIVQYKRYAYLYNIGDIRITLDFNIKSTPHVDKFLNLKDIAMIHDNRVVLEIKYDDIIPLFIRDLLLLPDNYLTDNSKYLRARVYDI